MRAQGVHPPGARVPTQRGLLHHRRLRLPGQGHPELAGSYFYSDFCTAILRSFRLRNGKVADAWDWKTALDPDSKIAQVTAFGEDQDGEIYLVSQEGTIFKLVHAEKGSTLTSTKP